jgi:hypothetical protein
LVITVDFKALNYQLGQGRRLTVVKAGYDNYQPVGTLMRPERYADDVHYLDDYVTSVRFIGHRPLRRITFIVR